MNWFKREGNKIVEAVKAVRNIYTPETMILPKTIPLQEQLARTFQRGAEHLRAMKPDGAMDSSIGMDEIYPDMTSVKFINSRPQGIPAAQIDWYSAQGFIGWQTCAMLLQNWLIDKCCTMPAKDACRNGYEVTVNDGSEVDPEILEYIRKKDKEFKVLQNCVEFVRMGRCFGIRHALFLVDSPDPDYYEKPFNPDGVRPGSYRGITQIDPYWMAPLLDLNAAADMASKHFYEPTWWLIQGKRVHRSHLIIFTTGAVPDILKPSYFYGGVPIPQKIAQRVYAAERVADEAPLLALTKRTMVQHIDLAKAAGNREVVEANVAFGAEFQNNFGVKLVDIDETVEMFDTSLADLDAAIMTQYQIVAAAANVPATKLLGTSPKGFNATGEFELSSYHEELESVQEHDLTALVERHHLLLMRSYVAPKFGVAPFGTEVNFKPVDSPTAAELAEVNLKKAQSDSLNVQVGALGRADVRNRLIADKDSGYNGIEAITDDLVGEEEFGSEI